jgi:hypothetical protein
MLAYGVAIKCVSLILGLQLAISVHPGCLCLPDVFHLASVLSGVRVRPICDVWLIIQLSCDKSRRPSRRSTLQRRVPESVLQSSITKRRFMEEFQKVDLAFYRITSGHVAFRNDVVLSSANKVVGLVRLLFVCNNIYSK